jgi:hypothetical protein
MDPIVDFFGRCKGSDLKRAVTSLASPEEIALLCRSNLGPACRSAGEETCCGHLFSAMLRSQNPAALTKMVMTYMDDVITRLHFEPQLIRLGGSGSSTAAALSAAQQALESHTSCLRHIVGKSKLCNAELPEVDPRHHGGPDLKKLSKQLEPTNASYEMYVGNGDAVKPFGKSFQKMCCAMEHGSAAAEGGESTPLPECVCLSARIRKNSALSDIFSSLAEGCGMGSVICRTSEGWTFGPTGSAPAASGGYDPRGYLITATRGALTATHTDMGVQCVLYFTVEGTNTFVGVPTRVAAALKALKVTIEEHPGFITADSISECFPEFDGVLPSKWDPQRQWLSLLETRVLEKCLSHRLLEHGEFNAGEGLFILPRGGHAVLSGPNGKVVVAGEWHHDGSVRTKKEEQKQNEKLSRERKRKRTSL